MDVPPMPVSKPLIFSFPEEKGIKNIRKKRESWWKKIFFIGGMLMMTTCATNPPPRATVVPKPVESRAIAPTADKVRKQVSAMGDTINDLRGGLETAVNEADRLRKQKTANEEELNRMWAILTKEKERAAQLWNQLEESQRTIDQLNQDALARDIEIDQLRKNNDFLNSELVKAQKWIDSATPKVAVYDFFQKWIRWVAIGLIIALVIWLLFQYVLPLVVKLIKPI